MSNKYTSTEMSDTKNYQKQQYTKVSRLLNKRNLTRDEFVRNSDLSKHSIVGEWGSYSNFKFSCERALDDKDQPTLDLGNTFCKEDVPINEYPPECCEDITKGKNNVKFNHKGDEGEAYSVTPHIKTLDQLLDACGVDRNIWSVKNYTVNKWDNVSKIPSKNADGEWSANLERTELFQVKANLERKNIKHNLDKVLSRWTPPTVTIPAKTSPVFADNVGSVFMPVLSDLHIGASARAAYMFNREEWTTEKTIACIKKFTDAIIKDARKRGGYNKAVVACLGDLLHSVNGKTSRGTQLKYDYVKEEQFEYAMDVLSYFFTAMIEEFGDVEVKATFGNHAYEIEMGLFRALKAYFRNDSRIKFELFSTRPASFVIDNSLIMVDHGGDSEYKFAGVPRGPKRETHIQSLMLADPNNTSDIKHRYFMMGHEHHWIHEEYSNFEFFMFGTSMGGDEHAAANNWRNRARQSCIVFDKHGVSDTIHTYFTD